MRSFIYSFRAIFIALAIIGTIELSCWVFAPPKPLAASNFLELAYLKPENNSKTVLQARTQLAISLHPDIIQVGDSSGLHGGVPSVINTYLGGLSYLNGSFGADVGYLGHYGVAKTIVDHANSVKMVVLYVTPLAKPAYYGNAGRVLERSINSSFVNPWHYLAPFTMGYRMLVTNLIYYGDTSPDRPHGASGFLNDIDLQQEYINDKGFVGREFFSHVRDPLPLKGCRFADWFELTSFGDTPYDYFYLGMQKMAEMAREKKIRLMIVFNPVPCHEEKEEGTLTIERELARFRKDYPEVVFPNPLITTWPQHLYVDSWHFFTFGAEIMSNKLGEEVKKTFADPNYRGVPPQSVSELDASLAWAHTHPIRPAACEDTAPSKASGEPGIFTNCLGMRFATLPAGRFVMGSCLNQKECPRGGIADPYALEREQRAHVVKVSKPFQMGEIPVTVGDLRTFFETDDGTHADPHTDVLHIDPLYIAANAKGDDYPVNMISWDNAQAYVSWLNRIKPVSDKGIYRLPTEAEWEYAARSGSQTAFWWGNDIGMNMEKGAGCNTRFDKVMAPPRSFPPNRFGLYDMNGNVWQLVEDCYRDWYGRHSSDTHAFEKEGCEMRSIRGGDADYPAPSSWSRATARIFNAHDSKAAMIGFRLVREMPADSPEIPINPFPAKGKAIASGNDPAKAFDGDPATFWISPEKGAGVMGKSWIGTVFDKPESVRRIEIEQPDDARYRQKRVLVQESADGTNWTTVRQSEIEDTKPVGVISLPAGSPPANHWRLLADSDNQAAQNQAWAPLEVRFFIRDPVPQQP